MKISKIKIKNYLGVNEIQLTPGDINVFSGPNGCGKTSIIEAIEQTFESKPKRRTETVRHGETEATLYIETDNGIEIDRKIRTDKADYLKVKSSSTSVNSTEGQLRSFFSGSVFRPLDFIDWKPKKQTDTILNTINIPFSENQFIDWFGTENVLTGINTDKHVLMILKEIETRHFATRQDTNRDITTLEHQALGIEKELPDNYNGDEWSNVDLQELYSAVTKAQESNQFITKNQAFINNYETEKQSINNDHDQKIRNINLSYVESENDMKDIIVLANNRIKDAETSKVNAETQHKMNIERLNIDKKAEYDAFIEELNAKYKTLADNDKNAYTLTVQDADDSISINNTKISNKRVEIAGLDSKKKIEIDAAIENVELKLGNIENEFNRVSATVQGKELVEIQPLIDAANNAETMRSHLREWDRIKDIRNIQIAEKSRYSAELTTIIETARNLPSTLLKQHELPIDGIAVDENGFIRINGTLLDGLSDGEKLETALRIALHQIGELRIMCLDRFEMLDPNNQKKVIKFCEDNDIQAFITIPDAGEGLEISDHI